MRFKINWHSDGARYTVSIPNYNGGVVVTIDEVKKLEAEIESLNRQIEIQARLHQVAATPETNKCTFTGCTGIPVACAGCLERIQAQQERDLMTAREIGAEEAMAPVGAAATEGEAHDVIIRQWIDTHFGERIQHRDHHEPLQRLIAQALSLASQRILAQAECSRRCGHRHADSCEMSIAAKFAVVVEGDK